MTKHDTDATQQIHAKGIGPTRYIQRIAQPALLALAFGITPAWAEAPQTFVLQASGFESGLVASDQGRLIQAWPGRPQQIAPDRWLVVDFERSSSVWFDDAGRVSLKGPYVELRSDTAFERHRDDPDPTSLFSTWSRAGTALLRADGSTFVDWQPGSGEWSITAHPQRYSWRSREAGERIFDARGQLRMQLAKGELRAAGPFPERTEYLVCDLNPGTPCALRDEAGKTLWTERIDNLIPLSNGSWLGLQGRAWRRLDAGGQLAGDRTLIYLVGYSSARSRSPASEDVGTWPRWATEYHVIREDAEGIFANEADAVDGLMYPDGRFQAIAGATSGEEVCPGIWRARMGDAGDKLVDANGQVLGPFTAYAWKEVEGRPELRQAIAEDGQETLVDCRGKLLVQTPPLSRLSAEATGFFGRLDGESQPRLWLDAELGQHLMPKGTWIDQVGADGALLLVRSDAEGSRMYHVKHGRFVGETIGSAHALLPGGVVFLRDGYYGFIDADGVERLPPRYTAITPWGEDRLWTSRYLADDAPGRITTLHRMDGSPIASWLNASMNDSPILRSLPNQGSLTELIGPTFERDDGEYLGQQWVDRNGRTVFLSLDCQRGSQETDGSVIEPLTGPARRQGTDCPITDDIRAAMSATRTN
ncbi:TPA: WG repeat-containing protein [Stenotrophomonas maltophilia]|nr:WG repeat-containing protein [Stenotrophomonas maltophilia]